MDVQQLFRKFRKGLAGQYAGSFRHIFSGAGVEVADSRKYVSGDAKKFINRKQSAKHTDLYVSLFAQERDVQVDVLCDINYNRCGSIHQPNSDLVFAYLTDFIVFGMSQGIRCTFFYPAGLGLSEQPLLHGGQEWYLLQHRLEKIVQQQKPSYISVLSLFLDRMGSHTKKRVIMIISDFLDVSETDVQRLVFLSHDHTVVLVRVSVSEYEGKNYIGGRKKNYTSLKHLFIDL